MARGTTLTVLRQRLKAEVGDAQETNDFADAEYNLLLAQKQLDLANAYDWSFLEHRWNLDCPAGTRYIALPTSDIRGTAVAINFERPVLVERFYNTKYWTTDFGIEAKNFNWRNSDLDERLDPIQRWQFATNVNESAHANEIEVWPIPITGQTLRFTGQRAVQALASGSDTADLDDMLLVYFVAAERLMLRDQKSAQYKLAQAQAHLMRLRGAYKVNEEPLVLGRKSSYERDNRRITPLVVVH
jgi:hypothetical protein